MAKKRIYNYVFHPGISYTDNLNPNAYFLLQQNKTFLQKEVKEWIDEQVANATIGQTFYNYTFNAAKCERDVGYAIDAYLYDMRYGGNSKTIEYISLFWEGDVSQVDGNRQAEVEAHTFLKSLVLDYVLTNTTYPDARQSIATQVIDVTKTAESGAVSQITTLLDDTTNIILNGLSVVPTLQDTGVGYIKVQGNYSNADLLLITNTDRGEIIYNFSNSDLGGFLEYTTDSETDEDFAKFADVTDAVTKINLFYDTSSHSDADDLQIFIDDKELKIRPYDFGTDAIERMRIAPPLSMLDADFEYGLQPTKWSAIGTLRGYPSTYEVPGTEISVNSVTTDASTSTQGVGASIITVTTNGPHGFTLGSPVVIKALDQGVDGSARAEGTFVIVSIPDATSFTYLAKSKVGDSAGEELATSFTILREAGFYTGSSIGGPEWEVVSQGSNGTLNAALDVPAGSNIIPFENDVPELGSPLTGAGIEIGTQVTGVTGTGGIVTTPDITSDAIIGATSFDVDNVTGIEPGLAIDRGDGTGVTVLNVVGNTVNLSSGITSPIIGNNVTYTGLNATAIQPIGAGAEFTISRAAGSYTIDAVTQAGNSYEQGDFIEIDGSLLGGVTLVNDALIEITSVDVTGAITGTNITGTAFDGNATYTDLFGTYQNGNGSGAEFDVTFLNNSYSVTISDPTYNGVSGTSLGGNGSGALFDVSWNNNVYSATINAADHTGYAVNDIIVISGTNLGGTTPANDLYIKVGSVETDGSILSLTTDGSAPDGNTVYNEPTYTTSGAGIGATFNVTATGATYSVIFALTGTNFAPGDTITVLGTNLGGATPTNDLTITIDTVDTGGEILTFTESGTAVNTGSASAVVGTNLVGSGANFDVTLAAGSYSVSISSGGAGANYATGQEILIPGTSLGGASPANDLTITVDTITTGDATAFVDEIATISAVGTAASSASGYAVNDLLRISGVNFNNGATPTNDLDILVTGVGGNGEITTFSFSGTAPDAQADYSGLTGTTSGSGSNATWNVQRTGTVYTPSIVNIGQNYLANDTITILGTDLGGTSPANDLVITVQTIDTGGEILTFTSAGTARNEDLTSGLNSTTDNIAGTGASFDVVTNAGTYAVTLNQAGSGYTQNQQIVISGAQLGGVTPTHDLTITITAVGATGEVSSISFAGTAAGGSATYTDVSGSNRTVSGLGASFSVTRSGGLYSNLTVDSGGSGYAVGNRLLIDGNDLGGASSVNDITVVVSEIDTATGIVAFTSSGNAVTGSTVDFLSTITISEVTTDAITTGDAISFSALATIEITFPGAHGLVPGSQFAVSVTSDDGVNLHTLAGGAYIATEIPASNSLRYQARAPGTIDTGIANDSPIKGAVYPSPDSFFIHRPYDGGVQLGTGGPQHGAQAIRQSKKYIRYQSGKGIMYTTGALFAPSYDLLSVFADDVEVGSTITVETDGNDHGLQVGGGVRLIGVESAGYNGDYTVVNIINERTFQVRANKRLSTGDMYGDWRYGPDYSNSFDTIAHPDVSSITYTDTDYSGGANPTFRFNITDPADKSLLVSFLNQYDLAETGLVAIAGTFTANIGGGTYVIDGLYSYENIYTNGSNFGLEGLAFVSGTPLTTFADNDSISMTPGNDLDTTLTLLKFGKPGYFATLGFEAQVSTRTWNGATVRSGIFDDQNGIFWEYDGERLSVVQRTATKQIAGTVAVASDSNQITGTNTRFRDQLKAGDRIVIKGMTHVVSSVSNQTTMTVTPDFRGVSNVSGAKVCLITDKKIQQKDFNLDRLDGTGPSKYNIDPAKMQMIGIQYSWYGAGFIDYMVRGADGNFVYAHRIRNSNVNTEAYMRSGNLPVRYEITNEGAADKLRSNIDDNVTVLPLVDASFFPSGGGVVYIDNELISFTGVDYDLNNLTGCTRSASLVNFTAGAQRSYTAGVAASHSERTGVVLVSNTITPLISHWGSSFITDGNFDEDRGYIFSYTEAGVGASTSKQTAFLLRLAPSVSNAITGDLGERELLNRAQLLIQGIEITSDGVDGTNNPITGGLVVEGILNPKNYPTNPNSVIWSGLSTQAQGGQPSFAQIAAGGGIEWTTGGGPTTVNVDWQGDMTLSGIENSDTVDASGGGRDDQMYVYQSNLDPLGLRVGAVCTTAPFNGRKVTQITGPTDYGFPGGPEYLVEFDGDASNAGTNYAAGELSLSFTFDTERTNSPVAFFTEASWNSSGLQPGALIDSSDTNWPANTSVNQIRFSNFGTTNYYEVRMNNSSTATLNGTIPDQVIFVAGESAYAEPGETVFSFIATPGERANLDLSQLKELTNTTLGGRGTFPNGPDVLAINVYKTSGVPTTANIILRWGEAQA